MAEKSKIFKLYKVNPDTDGAMNFNIRTMLNDNWDSLEAHTIVEQLLSIKGINYITKLNDVAGQDEWTTTFTLSGETIATVIEREKRDGWETEIKINTNPPITRRIIETYSDNKTEGSVE